MNKFNFSSDFTIGNLLAVGCSIFLGIGFIISESVRKEIGTISYSRTLFSTAAITLLFISFLTNANLLDFTYTEFVGLLLLGIIPTLFGHGTMYYAIRYVSPTIVAAIPTIANPTIFGFVLHHSANLHTNKIEILMCRSLEA